MTSFVQLIKEAIGSLLSAGVISDEKRIVSETPTKSLTEVMRRFWPYARPYRRWIPLLLVLVALGSALEAATIWMYKVLVDDVLVPQNFNLLVWVMLAYLGLMIASGTTSFADRFISSWVGGRFIVGLRTDFYRHLHGLSLSFFERRPLGDMLSRLSNDIEELESMLLSGVVSTIAYALQLVFFVGALFYLQWSLALISLTVVPLFWLTARYFSRRIKRVSREERRRNGSIGAVAEEGLSNVALVQAYNRQDEEVLRFHREGEGNFAAQMASTKLSALFSPFVDLIELAGVLIVIAVGAYELSQGRLTIGGLLVFIVYLSMLYRPIQGLSSRINSFYSASAGAERIMEFLDQEPSVTESEEPITPEETFGQIEFDDVTFGYPESGRRSLSGVSFDVGPDQVLALVGHSGAGKSTIAKLLLRFYDPDAGAVKLDGYDLRDLSLRWIRENVAMLMQETLVFDGTVRENIAFGKTEATDEEIVRAAQEADAHEFISKLPQGYDTVIGQRGRLLSGGQRQRIAIARAMIRDAKILILDEPTTGLDAASSVKIMAPLQRLMSGRTTIVISHNLMTVLEASEIVFLKQGSVAQRGTHDELLHEDGGYAQLYRLHRVPASASV